MSKASGSPRKSSKCQDCLITFIQLWDWGTISAELAQEGQQAGVSASARTVGEMEVDGVFAQKAA